MVKHTSQYVCVFLISIYCSLLDKIYGGLAKIICTHALSLSLVIPLASHYWQQLLWNEQTHQVNEKEQDTAKRLYPKLSDIFNSSQEDI